MILFVLLPFGSNVQAADDYILIGKIGLYKEVQLIIDSDLSAGSYFYDLTKLGEGVGYLQNMSWGNISGGRTVLVGHTPGAFAHINELDKGDQIILGMNGVEYEFTVTKKYIVNKSNDNVISTIPNNFEVVLITCTDNPDERLIIKAQ